jgi:hypothetical protein
MYEPMSPCLPPEALDVGPYCFGFQRATSQIGDV